MEEFEFITDAGETIFVQPRNQLTYVEQTILQRIRPGKFREILQIDSSIPEWADEYSYDVVQGSAQWVPVEELTDEFANAQVKFSKEGGVMYELVSGYAYRDREMAKAQRTGIQLDTARADQVMKKAETVLDWIAMNGTTNGVKALRGMTGLYNQVGITPLTTPSIVTTKYESQFTTAGTNPDSIDSVIENMVNDALLIEVASETATKETAPIDKLVLPLSLKPLYSRSKTRSSDKNAMQLIMERSQFIKSIVFNSKAETLGASGKRRIVGLRSGDPEAARFILSKAPMPSQGVRTLHGVQVPVGMVVGGFNTKIPESLIYVDAAV
jgi:hypothetical protein